MTLEFEDDWIDGVGGENDCIHNRDGICMHNDTMIAGSHIRCGLTQYGCDDGVCGGYGKW